MKLYYEDQYIQDFETVVNRNGEDNEGNYVVLKETAFYPTGGGQPHDTGTLNHFNVVNVEEVKGEIRHYIDGIMQPGDKVAGKINWNRRIDHMQQHTGQHILTAAFEELYQFETLSFHLGTDTSTIDLNTESITEEQLSTAEARCNEIILENLPIETKWINEGEISQYPLRKMPSIKDNIRLVIIPNVDYNSCGGTHPKTTGEVMGLKVLHWERQKKES
ncbi:MAG: alanyl-tRNA editing protein [Bacillus sp. (in: Bacteria)]|nr:alanyl-tRNA editing protein [Bacillus sp. (in: firmicutes)]